MRRISLMGAMLVAFAAGCGGGGGSSTPSPTAAPTTAPTATPTSSAAPLPQSGGTIPASGASQSFKNYSFLIQLARITSGSPANGFVDYNDTTTLAHGIAPSLPASSGTALLYFGFLITRASSSGVTFSAQPGFTIGLPSVPPAGTRYYIAESDPTAANPRYVSIAGPVTAGGTNGTTVTLPSAAGSTFLKTNGYYSYVFYTH